MSSQHQTEEFIGENGSAWLRPDLPRNGWILDSVDDLGQPIAWCDACGTAIRYVHRLCHQTAGWLEVGCICAGHLTGDPETAAATEQSLRRRAGQRARWLTRKWRRSQKGNKYLKLDGIVIVIFPRGGAWLFSVGDVFVNRPYLSEAAAMLGAFDEWCQQVDDAT